VIKERRITCGGENIAVGETGTKIAKKVHHSNQFQFHGLPTPSAQIKYRHWFLRPLIKESIAGGTLQPSAGES
jgi:hypothetical protein